MNDKILFSETQRFKQWWIWLILLGINGLILFGVYKQLITGEKFGNKPMSDTGLILTLCLTLAFLILFFSFNLKTIVKEDGIYVRFFPFHLKYRHFKWDSISKCYVRDYKPIAEYGGWGLRGFGSNRALNVSGKIGLQLEFSNGNKLLIGTSKGHELKKVLAERDSSK